MAENLPALPVFSWPTTETNQFDVEVAGIQACTYRDLAWQHVNAVSVRANADMYMEQIRQHAETTRAMVQTTEHIMLRAIDAHATQGPVSFIQSEVKTKLSGLFGRSCKISVRSVAMHAFQLRGPVR